MPPNKFSYFTNSIVAKLRRRRFGTFLFSIFFEKKPKENFMKIIKEEKFLFFAL